MPTIDKDRPSAEWIADLQRRLPCETEVDRTLTRKLARRAGPGFSWPGLGELTDGLTSLLESELGDAFHGLTEVRWLGGGASKVQMYFELAWSPPESAATRTPLVLRLEPAAAIQETSRRREFELLRAFAGEVPVPAAHWLDADGEHLPYPAMICGFMAGVTKPTSTSSGVTGMGTSFGPQLRRELGAQFVAHLATIHRHAIDDPVLVAFDVPTSGREAVTWQLNTWERIWEEDCDLEVPLMRLAAAWLRANIPDVDRLSIVHGDYRTGNFLFTEHDRRITALLDWEGGHVSDRHEDLGYVVNRVWAVPDEHGAPLATGLMSEAEFLSSYEQASGLPVDLTALAYWKVFNSYKLVAIAQATAFRIARGRKTHQDVLVSWLVGTGPILLEQLRLSLATVT